MMKKKKFSDFAETLHIDSTPKVIYFIFGVKRENFLMGLKIDFKFEIFDLKKWEIFLQNEKSGNPFTKIFDLKKWEIFLQNRKKRKSFYKSSSLKKRGNLFTK